MSDTSTSATRKAIAAISGGPCAELLRSNGFKRKAPNFWRETEGIFQCVNFQASQWGARSAGRFIINLGVTSPALYTGFTGRVLPKNPTSVLWPINKRIGRLTPDPHDLWWSVEEGTDIDRLGNEVTATLAAYALPFLDSLRTPQLLRASIADVKSLAHLPEGQSLLVRASMAAHVGESDNAQMLMNEAFQKYKGEPLEAAIHRIAAALGLELHDA